MMSCQHVITRLKLICKVIKYILCEFIIILQGNKWTKNYLLMKIN